MWHKTIRLSFVFCLMTGGVSVAEENQPIMIGLLPDEEAAVLLERFEPVRARLERTLKRPVKVVIPSLEVSYTYDDLVNHFVDGKIQVAYFGALRMSGL